MTQLNPFSDLLADSLVHILLDNSDHLRGDKIYGAALVRDDSALLPHFSIFCDCDSIDTPPADRWVPGASCRALRSPQLTELAARFDARRTPADVLPGALGSGDLRGAFARLGADPILYIYDADAGGIDAASFNSLNSGRESEPYYLQAARFLR